MIGRIGLYLIRQIGLGTVLVSLGLVGILWLTQSLRFIEFIVNKGLSVGSFLYLTLLLLPNFLSIILPIALFTAILFTYNRMIADREIPVLRAAGMSQWRLARSGVIAAMVSLCLCYLLTLFLIPHSVRAFRELEWGIKNNVSSLLLQEGTFNTIGKNITIYLRSRGADGELLDVLVHDQRKPDKPVTLLAERGEVVQTDKGARVLMTNGSRQEVAAGTGRLSILYFDSYAMDINAQGDEGGERHRDARERSLSELLNQQENSDLTAAEIRSFRAEAHQRLSSPLLNLSFAMIALAVLLTGGFSRHGQTRRVLFAIGAMVLIQTAAIAFAGLAIKSSSFAIFLYGNAIAPILGGAYMLWRSQR